MNYNNNQNNILLNKVLNFYTPENTNTFIDIIENKYNISLRIIDWFVTIYCKNKHVQYPLNNNNFNVYESYKLMGKSYKKRKFDPFCRGDRIFINHNNHNFETTIGQLNFFKWALENDVIKYIQENYDKIEADMNSRNSTSKRRNTPVGNKTRKKREELSVSASKSIYREDVKIVVTFD